MKHNYLFFLIFLLSLSINLSFGQISASVVKLRENDTLTFNQIFKKYNLNKDVPTIAITWSGKWCVPCIHLINMYNACDPTMINLITINVDNPNNLQEVLNNGNDLEWNNAINFRGNLGKSPVGFNNVFNVSLAPLILYIKDGKIEEILTGYAQYPYRLVLFGKIPDVKLIWNSPNDLNSLAWYYYRERSSPEELQEAKTWVTRAIELDKNYYNMDTYSSLLFKTGEYTKALKTAKEAIDIAKVNDIKHERTTELINKIIEQM
ncbi:MAG: hypothetical protein KJP14_07085 [Eudoraea sp.]|nr:hypothetical protein [Eudoraea sp.]MBT8210275.1 hypothetical protein [Eudoraea sp.]MBT8223089.1 hypothetical protein [Eudoraea sp.]MBT8322493.1 hypothetical protein [Eudoraea sp.]NNK30426.1 hypothetical protein [Flavobacteriaceae bacterium]